MGRVREGPPANPVCTSNSRASGRELSKTCRAENFADFLVLQRLQSSAWVLHPSCRPRALLESPRLWSRTETR